MAVVIAGRWLVSDEHAHSLLRRTQPLSTVLLVHAVPPVLQVAVEEDT